MLRRQEASPSAGSPGTRCTDRTARSAPTPHPETRPAGDESSNRWVILQSLTFPKSLLESSLDNHHKYFGKFFCEKHCVEPQTNVFFFCLFGWFLNVLVKNWAILRTHPKTERKTILRAATHETELGDHDFCLSRSHYTDTDLTSR